MDSILRCDSYQIVDRTTTLPNKQPKTDNHKADNIVAEKEPKAKADNSTNAPLSLEGTILTPSLSSLSSQADTTMSQQRPMVNMVELDKNVKGDYENKNKFEMIGLQNCNKIF